MSNFEEPVREYKFSDARLVELALEKIAFARRDATELEGEGIDEDFVNDLETKTMAFGELPSDDVELGEQREATEDKQEEEEAILGKLREMRSAAKRAFGENSSEYKSFKFKDMDHLPDAGILRLAMVNKGLAATYETELSAKGYDAADNTALGTLITAYVGGLQNQVIEVGSRDSAQENRVLKGNEIYNLLEKQLCEAGKNYWRTRSAAKYNDYFIYNNEHGVQIPDVVTNTPLLAAQINVISSDEVADDAWRAYAKNTGPEGCEIAFYYGTLGTESYSGTGVVITSGNARNMRQSDLGTVQPFLLAQNISGINGGFDFGVL